jgi:hypothetical protein
MPEASLGRTPWSEATHLRGTFVPPLPHKGEKAPMEGMDPDRRTDGMVRRILEMSLDLDHQRLIYGMITGRIQ